MRLSKIFLIYNAHETSDIRYLDGYLMIKFFPNSAPGISANNYYEDKKICNK